MFLLLTASRYKLLTTCLLSLVHRHARVVSKAIFRLSVILVVAHLALVHHSSAVVTVVLICLHFCAVDACHICNSWVVCVRLISLAHVQWQLSATPHIGGVAGFDIAHGRVVDFDGGRLSVRVGHVYQVFEKPLIVFGLVAYTSELLRLTTHCAIGFQWGLLELLLLHFLACWTISYLLCVVVDALRTRRGIGCLIIWMLD